MTSYSAFANVAPGFNQLLTAVAFIITVLFSTSVTPQPRNIRIGGAINSYEPEEVCVAINPSNTDHLLVGANVANYYYSTDGGLSWRAGVVNSSFGVVGDPCVLTMLDKYYYIHLIPGLSKVVCQRASGLGEPWSDGTFTGLNGSKQNDKEYAAVDYIHNRIYLTWAQFDSHGSSNPSDSSEIQFSRSTDEGQTWSVPVRISNKNGNAQGGNASCHSPMPAAGPDNEAYVTWWSNEGLMFDKSTDGGLTWPARDVNVSGSHINWLVFNIPGIQRAPGFPIINCDLSNGSFRGNIYICWADQRSGSANTDIWLAVSTDRGNTWSQPKRVNDDNSNKHQFFPWMTVDQVTGHIYFVFYDRRNYPSGNANTDVYMAVSRNGGNLFENMKISESSFFPTQNDFLGDYIGIAAHNNRVRPVWTRVDNGQLSVWTALIDSSFLNKISDEEIYPNVPELLSVYPNPFNSTSTIRYRLQSPGNVKIKLYDLMGHEISTVLNEFKQAGSHSFQLEPGELSSGVYIISCAANRKYMCAKFVYLK